MPNRSSQNKVTIEIPASKFDLYELVTLNLNEQERTVKVVRRWFNLEDNFWWYKIHSSEGLYPENALSVLTEVF